jgi:predicted nucleic acid-binding protein
VAAYFFDSSAVVKRYVREIGTAWVLSITAPTAGHFIYVAHITGVEVVSAITRQARHGAFAPTDAATALVQFRHDFAHQYHTVDITSTLIARAMALAETHALRGYDAVQCAAALVIHSYRQTLGIPLLTLVSADAALNTSAAAEGLQVDNPNAHP